MGCGVRPLQYQRYVSYLASLLATVTVHLAKSHFKTGLLLLLTLYWLLFASFVPLSQTWDLLQASLARHVRPTGVLYL